MFENIKMDTRKNIIYINRFRMGHTVPSSRVTSRATEKETYGGKSLCYGNDEIVTASMAKL